MASWHYFFPWETAGLHATTNGKKRVCSIAIILVVLMGGERCRSLGLEPAGEKPWDSLAEGD